MTMGPGMKSGNAGHGGGARPRQHGQEFMREQVRYLLNSEGGREWRLGDMAAILGCNGSRAKALRSVLAAMAEDGEVRVLRNGRYAAPSEASGTIEGRLEVARSGAGFVTDAANGRVLRIAATELGGAMTGDVVRVRPVRIGQDGESGRIVKIVSQSARLVCATVSISGGETFAVPVNPSYVRDIELDDAGGARNGDRVVVRIVSREGRNPRGEVVDVIGSSLEPSLDTETICREYELPGDFPPEVIAEAERAESSVADDDSGRMDLRKAFILTIDPRESKDFDDAISFERLPDGTRRLGVHIADVSHYVRPGSALDAEAFARGNSVYLVDKVIPMLPETLSNGICSLRPKVERRCFTVLLDFDPAGHVVSRTFSKSLIRSSLRLNYGQALAIIEGRKPEGLARVPAAARELLRGTSELALQLRARRMRMGALDLDVPECRPIIDGDGRMTGFAIEEYDISHQMIEECMVAANEAVATELSMHGWRILSRLHEPPDPLKIDDLGKTLSAMGFSPGDISHPANLSRFIASIADHPLKAQAHTAILRSMRRALYSAKGHGHFGLAKSYYSHFTSPIRRYADLVLHRQLAAYVARLGNPVGAAALESAAVQCTAMEQRADEAERTLLEIKKFRFLDDQVKSGKPDELDAVVSKVTSFGVFVDIPSLALGGLVHLAGIGGGRTRLDRSSGTLVAGSRRWKAGQKVRVIPARVDMNARRLDFSLVGQDSRSGGRRSGARRR